MNKMYLVSYFFWTNNISSGFGDTYVSEEENEDICTVEGIEVIRKAIVKKMDLVVVQYRI